MPRRPRKSDGAAARPIQAAPVEPVGLEFGQFPEISPLNLRFLPGQERLKLTLDIDLAAGLAGRTPAVLIDGLRDLLPSLSRHRCCGDNHIQETFFKAKRRPACAMRESDEAVDVAHLLEHLVIDFQHFIADMRVCSGVTCGYRRPRYRYDLFVESPDRDVGRLSAALACNLLNDLLRGASPDPFCTKILKLARHVYRNAGALLTAQDARTALEDDPQSAAALQALQNLSFIQEIQATVNFSGVPLYAIQRREEGLAGIVR